MLRFQASEIVDMAVRIERNGYAFYSGILEKTSDAKLRGIFDDLAKQEMHHIDDFRRLLEGVKRYEPAEEYVGEHQDYLGALADAHVFVNEGVGARVAEIVYGTPDPKGGAVSTLYRIASDTRLNHRAIVTPGVLAEECAALLTSFFRSRRSAPPG